MEVRIEMTPNKTSDIEYAKQVKAVAKDLIETCARCGVFELTYVHDYFKIHIQNAQEILQQNHTQILDLVQGEK